jgi:hypothetical protein
MIFVLLGLILVLSIWILRLERRLSKLLRGSNAETLESVINSLSRQVEELGRFRDDSLKYFKLVEFRLKRSVQAIETIRFNPFRGTGEGGNQSFSNAIINEKGDGVVLTGLYARDRVSIFAKPVKKFSSEFELTEEERQAVESAKQGLSYPKNI